MINIIPLTDKEKKIIIDVLNNLKWNGQEWATISEIIQKLKTTEEVKTGTTE